MAANSRGVPDVRLSWIAAGHHLMTRNIKADNASHAEGLVLVYPAVAPPSDAAKVGWCWAGDPRTWLGLPSAAGRRAAQLSASAIVIS
jgi:hypothetical protein